MSLLTYVRETRPWVAKAAAFSYPKTMTTFFPTLRGRCLPSRPTGFSLPQFEQDPMYQSPCFQYRAGGGLRTGFIQVLMTETVSLGFCSVTAYKQ